MSNGCQVVLEEFHFLFLQVPVTEVILVLASKCNHPERLRHEQFSYELTQTTSDCFLKLKVPCGLGIKGVAYEIAPV